MVDQKDKKNRSVSGRDVYDFFYRLFFRRPHYKFCTALLMAGAALISAPGFWEILFSALLGLSQPQTGDDAGIRAQVIGSVMVAVAVILLFVFHVRDSNEKKRQERKDEQSQAEAQKTDFKKNVSGLIGCLEDLAKNFSDPKIAKPPGYKSDEILEAKELAESVFDGAPNELRQNVLLNLLKNSGIDASGEKPVHSMSTRDIRELIDELKSYI